MAHNRSAIISELTELVTGNPAITLKSISQRLGVGRHTIERAVHDLAGVCFRQWRREMRVTLAAAVLHSSNLGTKEIAYQSGYTSARAFSRSFRAVMGVQPTRYRIAGRTGKLPRKRRTGKAARM